MMRSAAIAAIVLTSAVGCRPRLQRESPDAQGGVDADVDSGIADGGALDAGKLDGGPADSGAFSWREVSPCPVPRFEAMGAAVGGKLLVIGGFISASLVTTSAVDVYDPATDSWT